MTEPVESSKILSMAKRRGFLWPAYEIYGGLAGFYDYGPIGSMLRENIINLWRCYFVYGERCAEIVTPDITPEEVFIASGHVNEFSDFMVQCKSCKSVFRADHLLENLDINADNLKLNDLTNALVENEITCPDCRGKLSSPKPVNLMFETKIGIGNPRQAYLRPETAQGMFVNFHYLYRYFRDKLPFGIAQIGRGFRNEISPRQGIIRLREMTMAELEYFFNPKEKKFKKIEQISKEKVTLIPEPGVEHRITLDEAIKNNIINSEILAYFIGLTKQFLIKLGIKENKLRFRKHQPNEMAHYANECWDAEALTSFNWMEIIGIADRSAYDLNAHIKATNQELTAYIPYDEPVEREVEQLEILMNTLGPLFKGDAGAVKAALEDMAIEQIKGKESVKVKIDDKEFEVPNTSFNIKTIHEKVSGERIIPNVIEPSFGIDRIFYTLLEHSYHEQKPPNDVDNSDIDDRDEKENKDSVYRILRFNPWIAPIKVGVFPLMAKDNLDVIAREIDTTLREKDIQTYYDESGSIGRRYARMDEIGTPICVTVDYDSKEDETVTIRDRDSHDQIRIEKADLVVTLQRLLNGEVLFRELRILD
ncbi:MAG: glycine--tRNA ligase [Candidatus Thorarchaeota archaeon]